MPEGPFPEAGGRPLPGGDDGAQGIAEGSLCRLDGPQVGVEEIGEATEVSPQQIGALAEAGHPAPQRLHRNLTDLGEPAVTDPRRPAKEGFSDHLGDIPAAQKPEERQQDVGSKTAPTARAPGGDGDVFFFAPELAASSMAPGAQLLLAVGAGKPAGEKLLLDSRRVDLYHGTGAPRIRI